VASRSCRGIASLPRPRERPVLVLPPWHLEALATGLADMPDRGPNNEEPAKSVTRGVNYPTNVRSVRCPKWVLSLHGEAEYPREYNAEDSPPYITFRTAGPCSG
jgi:hypothetical protein